MHIHQATLDSNNLFQPKVEIVDLRGEPDHYTPCELEQRFLLRAIRDDLDLTARISDAIHSLRVVLAADESVRTGRTIGLDTD